MQARPTSGSQDLWPGVGDEGGAHGAHGAHGGAAAQTGQEGPGLGALSRLRCVGSPRSRREGNHVALLGDSAPISPLRRCVASDLHSPFSGLKEEVKGGLRTWLRAEGQGLAWPRTRLPGPDTGHVWLCGTRVDRAGLSKPRDGAGLWGRGEDSGFCCK